MKRNHTVSLCMIVKNEGKYLGRCLGSVSDIVDEIIIVDTGSTDETVDIANSYGAKVAYFKWNQNFSDARNQSLDLATKDWILVLDADEYLRLEDKDKLIAAFNDFSNEGYIIKTLNFNGLDNNQTYITNLNQRIFKNNKNYRYKGAIHEQVTCIDPSKQTGTFKILDVGFYHSGYLATVVKDKDKPNRNLEILKNVLKEDPTNTFTLFNLANEYSQLNELEEAFRLYDEAYHKENFSVGFMPKLVIFRLQCLINMNKINQAFEAIEEGLKAYPDYTELVYYRGLLEHQSNEVLKAIRSFEQCLTMGRPRAEIEFQEICYEFGPNYQLAEIYEEQREYTKAFEYYNKCLRIDPSKYQLLYPIFRCLEQLNVKKTERVQALAKYFDLSLTLNQIVFVDILLTGRCYEEARDVLMQCQDLNTNNQLIFLHARVELYLKNYSEAEKLFMDYCKLGHQSEVEHYLFIINLVKPETVTYKGTAFYETLDKIISENQPIFFENNQQALIQLCVVLKELYLCHETEWLERLIAVACEINDPSANLVLAQLLDEMHYKDLAEKVIVKTITQTKKCTKEVVTLLKRIN